MKGEKIIEKLNAQKGTLDEIAKAFGVRVYTIGVGTIGKALAPVGMYPDGSFEYGYVDVNIDIAVGPALNNSSKPLVRS